MNIHKPITVGDVEYPTLAAAVERYGANTIIVERKLEMEWTPDEAFGLVSHKLKGRPVATPVAKFTNSIPIIANGVEFESHNAAARHYGIDRRTFMGRVKRGATIEEAVSRPAKALAKSVTIGGVKFESIKAAAQHYGIVIGTLYSRLYRGMTPEEAVSRPVRAKGPLAIHGVKFGSLSAAARHYGINRATFTSRLRSGWTPEEAAGLVVRGES